MLGLGNREKNLSGPEIKPVRRELSPDIVVQARRTKERRDAGWPA